MALPNDWVIERVDEGGIRIPLDSFKRQVVCLIPIFAMDLMHTEYYTRARAYECMLLQVF